MKPLRIELSWKVVLLAALVLCAVPALATVSGSVTRWVGNILVLDGSSGSNGWQMDTDGLRGDLGSGSGDHLDSDGTCARVGSGTGCLAVGNEVGTGSSSVPSAPSSNQSTSFLLQFDGGQPALAYSMSGYYGVPSPQGLASLFTHYSTTTKWFPMCWLPNGWAQTTISSYNVIAPATVGNLAAASWASTSLLTRSKSARWSTAAGINLNAGLKGSSSTQVGWRGNTAGAGGWLFWTRWTLTVNAPHSRQMVGLANTTTFPAVTSEPSAVLDSVYVGCDSAFDGGSADLPLSICSNDNSGSATCTQLSSSFPCDRTANALYDVWLSAAPNASSIEWYVERLDSAATAAGTLTADLPRNTVQLNPIAYANTADGGTAISIDWLGTCMLANL